MNNAKVYFPGLNGLRFIAALLVFLSHTELLKKFRGQPNIAQFHFFKIAGTAGVNLFFCISGFLITYLLLTEKKNASGINLRDFYIRRILRIWPLYYFIACATLFLIPAIIRINGFGLDAPLNWQIVLLYLSFGAYIAKALFNINFLAAILWSIGVEETYYLCWPLFVKKLRLIKFSHFILLLIAFCGIKGLVTYLPYKISDTHHFWKGLSSVFEYLKIECMLTGGVFAWLLINASPVLKYLQNTLVFTASFLLWLVYLFFGFQPLFAPFNPIIAYLANPLIYALLCSILIINIINYKVVYAMLENKILFELGQISYGFYVYHSIAIMFVFIIFEKLNINDNYLWLLFLPAFILTVAFSWISYYGYEVRFLRLKHKFSHVLSGPEAR
jgi:peptidoglycan/LPS O-acetylase OafA/YrhL